MSLRFDVKDGDKIIERLVRTDKLKSITLNLKSGLSIEAPIMEDDCIDN